MSAILVVVCLIEQAGPRKFKVQLADEGIVWIRHKDHVRKRHVLSDLPCEPAPLPMSVPVLLPQAEDPVPQVDVAGSESHSSVESQPVTTQPATPESTPDSDSSVERTRRYPQRVRKPPDRYSSD